MSRMSLPLLAIVLLTMSDAHSQTDPYLWLEDVHGDKALEWVHAQNAETFAELKDTALFDTLYSEAYEIMTSDARLPNGTIIGDEFHDFWQDKRHVRGVWRSTSIRELARGKPEWKTVLDIDKLAADENENWVYKSINCEGGKQSHCLVELSRGGKDESIYREFSLATGKFIESGFVVPDAKSVLDWADADTLIVATNWGDDSLTNSGYAREARLWRRGTSLQSARTLLTIDKSDTLLAPVTYHSNGRSASYLVRLLADWNDVVIYPIDNGKVGGALQLPQRILLHGVVDDRLIIGLKEDWAINSRNFSSGDIIAFNRDDNTGELVYSPNPREAIDAVRIGRDGVYLQLLDNVVGRLKRLTRKQQGWVETSIDVPDNGVALLAATSSGRNDLFVSYESATQPTTLYYVSAKNKLATVAKVPPLYDASNVVIRQKFARSKDGTRVPYFLIGRKDILEKGDAPTILYGYGGFLIPILPVYYEDPSRPQHGALAGKMWISRGGVLVLANIRGGGEYGPEWHASALRENRQHAFDDYFSIAEDLIESGVTSASKLGALGRSNGGLLLGVALTQRPDLFAALDIGVPLLDMKRYNKLLAGSSWMGEYGNPDVPEDWAYISKYSPYQNLKDGVDYPRVFFYTSTQDDRVHPGHARKMAAKLGDMGNDFYYYENTEGGHGGTANQQQLAMRTALEYAYFIRMLMPASRDQQ